MMAQHYFPPPPRLRPPYVDHPLLPDNTQPSSPHIIDLELIARIHQNSLKESLSDYEITILDAIVTILYHHDLERNTRKLEDFLDTENIELFQYEWRREAARWTDDVCGMFIWRFRDIVQVGETLGVAQHPAIKISNRIWFSLPRNRASSSKKAINTDPWPLTRFAATSWSKKWQYDLDAEQQGLIYYDYPQNSRVKETEVLRRASDMARKWILDKVWRSRVGKGGDGAVVVVYGAPVGSRDPVKPVWDLEDHGGYLEET